MRFYKETNFKDTEIGRIPKEWEVVRLGQVLTYIKGKKPEKMVEEYREDYLPYLSTDYLRENKTTRFAKPSNDTIVVDDGDLILLWDGSNAGEFFFGKRGIVSSTMAKIELKEKNIDKSFFFYLLKTKESFLKGQTRGTGIPHVDACVLTNILVSLPPLSEQHKIAEILSTIDNAIQKINEIVAKSERLKKGLREELLTKGIGHKEFKDTEIGKIPREWEVVVLGDIAEINKESSDPRRELPNETFLYIDIDSIEGGTGKIRNPKRVLGKEAPSRARRVIHENDVIMSTVRPYLKAFAIVPKEYDNQICSTGFAVLSCRDTIFPYFLLCVLFSENVINQCNRMMMGGQYPALNQSQVSQIKIPLPPFQEQQKIAKILSTIDKRLEIERKEKEKLERIKQGMMDLLLTGKIRVKVA